jgi:accessory gene regulator B
MEKFAHKVSATISTQLHYDKEKTDVIAYGLTAIFQLITIGMIITVIGILCHMFYESAALFISVGILKRSTGGAHSNSIYACTVISIVMISSFAAISRYLLSFQDNLFINISLVTVIFLTSLVIFMRHVPVDSAHKPIVKPEKIKRLRKQSFILLTVYITFSIILFYFGTSIQRLAAISYSLLLAIIWQTVMLTKYGALFINAIDSILIVKEASK